MGTSAPVYADVAPLLALHCVSCHEGDTPEAGWRAASFLEAISCVADAAPATLPADERAPILRAQEEGPHRGLLNAGERALLESWVRAGSPAFRAIAHPPGIADPRSINWHGKVLRERRWAPMLDAANADACGRCHEGAPARPPGISYPAPGATACTKCHTEPEGALACGTCHGSGATTYPPRDPCFFPGDREQSGAHAAHATASATNPGGLPCATCHPTPSADVVSGVHGNGSVEIIFDTRRVGNRASYDRTTGACAVGCHDHGGARSRPAWNDTMAMRCGDCHGSPPASHYPGACSKCHAETDATGSTLTGGTLHMNGRVDLGSGSGKCGACHGEGDDPRPESAAHRAHANPSVTAPIACESCHVVPPVVLDPGHLDGTVKVVFSGHAVDRGAAATWDGQACSSVACHGAKLVDPPPVVPVWNDTSGAARACDACHRLPPTQHTASTSCDRAECHGSEVIRSGSTFAISASGKLLHVNGVIDVRPP